MSADVVTVPDGCLGVDTDEPIGRIRAGQLRKAGVRFAARYVGRERMRLNDLSRAEVRILHEHGLAVFAVQHVESDSEPGWRPDAAKGARYGANAARFAADVGLPPGTAVALDLEMIHRDVPKDLVVLYANAWHAEVARAGFLPVLYVGWNCRLSPAELYQRLRFQRYWSALNLNRDMEPAVRGVCLRQRECVQLPGVVAPDGCFQTDHPKADALGGRMAVFAPVGWTTAG